MSGTLRGRPPSFPFSRTAAVFAALVARPPFRPSATAWGFFVVTSAAFGADDVEALRGLAHEAQGAAVAGPFRDNGVAIRLGEDQAAGGGQPREARRVRHGSDDGQRSRLTCGMPVTSQALKYKQVAAAQRDAQAELQRSAKTRAPRKGPDCDAKSDPSVTTTPRRQVRQRVLPPPHWR